MISQIVKLKEQTNLGVHQLPKEHPSLLGVVCQMALNPLPLF